MQDNKIFLLVPDCDDFRKINALLTAAEYDVVARSDTCDIVNELDAQFCNLILADISLVTDSLIVAADSAGVPVMCLTNENCFDEGINEIYSRGCVDYATLPVQKHILIARVKNQIELRMYEANMHKAKDYLYNFAVSVTHDIKNQFTVSQRLSDWLLENDSEHIDNNTKIILEHLSGFCGKTRGLLECIEDKAVNESRHRGGFVRHTTNCNIG